MEHGRVTATEANKAEIDLASGTDVRRRTSQELAHHVIRQKILTGEITGGTRLVQSDIAQELRISTTPVREALRELAAEGLVTFDAHLGAAVTAISRREAGEILWLRTLLEPECMRLAALHRSEELLTEARRLERMMAAEADQAKWSVMNRAFHTVLSDAADSPRLAMILRTLRSASEICVYASLRVAMEPMATGNAHHRELVDAIERRDPDAAADIAIAHVDAIRVALGLTTDVLP